MEKFNNPVEKILARAAQMWADSLIGERAFFVASVAVTGLAVST